eukprot:6275193-Prymnesium_polylepis.1
MFNTHLILRHFHNRTIDAPLLESCSKCRVNYLCVSDGLDGINELMDVDVSVRKLLNDHLQAVARDFDTCMAPNMYLEHNSRLWSETCLKLGGEPTKCPPYPCTSLWSDLEMIEGGEFSASRRCQDATCSISLDDVLRAACSVSGADLNADAPLMDSGIDSLGATELRSSLESMMGNGAKLPATLVFERPTVRQIASFLTDKREDSPEFTLKSSMKATNVSAAIVSANSLKLPEIQDHASSTFRRIGACATNLVGAIPGMRWDADDPMLQSAALADKAFNCIRYGAFMSGIELFDNTHFSMSPAEVTSIDPQQRVLLELSYEALHTDARRKQTLSQANIGVFVGIDYNDFQQIVSAGSLRYSVHAATGTNLAVAAGRTSFALGLQGPCTAIDSSCSSGLVAAGTAQNAMALHQCDDALVSSVLCVLIPAGHVVQARAGMLSENGRCFTFDARADGFAKGEACGAVILRDESRQRQHRVSALVGHATRQDGRSASLTAPNGQAQVLVIGAALSLSGVAADRVMCVEAHGTGTALGDPTEVGSVVHSVLRHRHASHTSKPALGSTKANTGHAEPAA